MSDLSVRLNAVIVSVADTGPRVMTVPAAPALPAGDLEARSDPTLELALRRLVREQAGIELGYVEQLYTFGDLARSQQGRRISIAYLALVDAGLGPKGGEAGWLDCYELFPWEDWRSGRPALIDEVLVPALEAWVGGVAARRERADIVFGLSGSRWDGARVLDRFELLYEVGLVDEKSADSDTPITGGVGRPMVLDHRRMVATGLSRLRGKLAYRPVVFELLPETFTLNQLQRVVETLAGVPLHKPNFRRLVERGGLVEGTGVADAQTGGRPAELFRFRREVLRERPAPGVGLPGAR
ncbi:MAG: NAD regulator [Acidimicrobiia bacterium]|nr:NAD regulator [Acidimicrobiia bacterium]